MPTQKELADLRKTFLEQREALLKRKVDALQVKLYERVFESYLSELEAFDGKVVSNGRNISLIEGLDKIYQEFQLKEHIKVVRGFSDDLQEIGKLNRNYFANIDRTSEFNKRADSIDKLMNKRLGIKDGKLVKGGFLNKFISDTRLRDEIKDIAGKAVASGQSFQDMRASLKEAIQGSSKRDGGLQQYYRQFAYDTIQQVDRTNGLLFADELELNYCIYNGGLIETSRPHCVKYNGKLLSRQQIMDWAKLSWAKLLKSYNPMTDAGGPNCRHSYDWVTDSFAARNWMKYNGVAFPY